MFTWHLNHENPFKFVINEIKMFSNVFGSSFHCHTSYTGIINGYKALQDCGFEFQWCFPSLQPVLLQMYEIISWISNRFIQAQKSLLRSSIKPMWTAKKSSLIWNWIFKNVNFFFKIIKLSNTHTHSLTMFLSLFFWFQFCWHNVCHHLLIN